MAVHEEPPELGQLRDTSLLWRASFWGGATVVALATAILMTQTDIGAQRLHLIFDGEPAASRPVTQAEFAPRPDLEAQKRETLRLEAQVRELAADRERLNARIATLEQNLTDMTGSIKRELAAVATATPPSPPPTLAMPATTSPGPHASQTGHADDEPDAKEADALPQVAPPLGEPIPLPQMRVAAATAGDIPGSSKEIGIDLGGARSLEIMQARWAAVKANFGPLLNGLRPLVAHDNRPKMIPYRLIVGPLPNAAAAAQVCARFAASKVTCRATKFAGDTLAMPQ
jgi:hypothetical protein